MKKNIPVFILPMLLVLIMAFPANIEAHSKLETSLPAADAIVTEEVREVILSFNENIDPVLSSLNIQNETGEKVEPVEVQAEANELKGGLSEPLPSGQYTIQWKIIGLDGHPVEGGYRFEVEIPEAANELGETTAQSTEQPAESTAAPAESSESGQAEGADDTSVPAAASPVPESEEAPSDGNLTSGNDSSILWVVIIAAAVIGIVIGYKLTRKRQ